MKINWQKIGYEDYKAEYAGYVLRIESMDEGMWWCQIYIQDEPLWHENNYTETKQEAEYRIKTALKILLT